MSDTEVGSGDSALGGVVSPDALTELVAVCVPAIAAVVFQPHCPVAVSRDVSPSQ